MNDLRSIAVLQARVYEFLGQQDESTLQAIVGGVMRLAVLNVDDPRAAIGSISQVDVPIGSRPPSVGLAITPSSDPLRAAQDLPGLASVQERRLYLNASGLRMKGLRRIAKLLGLSRYSHLVHDQLISLLAEHGSGQAGEQTNKPGSPTRSSSRKVGDKPEDGQQETTHGARPSTTAPSAGSAKSRTDVAAIASHLRETETEAEGSTYLQAQHLDRETLIAVAAALQLTRVDHLSQTELEKRVLKQAIGARRKFAGLRRW